MNYINLLTQEERSILCRIITGREFNKLFKKNENEFSHIKKGFRAKSLTDTVALSTAITNVDHPFIAKWVNSKVDTWLNEINENIEKLESEGATHDIALATTMLDSFFVDNVDLYFKLAREPLDEDTHSNLCDRMESINYKRTKDAEVAERVKPMEEENRRLLNQIEDAQKNTDAIKSKYEQELQKIKQEKGALESLLVEVQEKITELQTTPTTVNRDDADQLTLYDDTNPSVFPSISNDEIVSLCSVISDYNGQKWVFRYADLSCNGHYHIFHRSDDIPPFFTNRDKIYNKDGPSNDGFYGIWTWSTIPNEKDPAKDYVMSHYNMDIDAIEIVTIDEVSNLDELIKLLKGGIEYLPCSRRIMFSLCTSKGQYIGIMCSTKELNIMDGKTAFANDCIVAPVYEFIGGDIMHLDNGLSFYRNAFAGIPSKLYHLKSPIEIVRNIVFSSISWATYKTRGFIRAEYRTFKDFLGAIPVDNITSQIETAYHCSNPTAKQLLDEFLNTVWKYVDGDSFEDEIILSAISASTELQEKTKALIRIDWKTENESLLFEAQRKLDLLNDKMKTAVANLTEVQESYARTKADEEHLMEIIAEKEKLAGDVEAAITQRIQRAREKAADFIADMAFVGGQQVQIAGTEIPSVVEVPSGSVITPYHTVASFENLNDLEAHHSWENVIYTASFELGEAGVAEQYRRGLATFLCAAYIEKQPILLVGPNAIDIIKAFSSAVSGHKHGVLYCEGNYSNQIIIDIGTDGEDIVIINNLLTSGWMNRLPEILSQKNIFYVATHPYAEDIQVEPKSLYGFMLPLFTEFFVDKKATGEYIGGYFADDFKTYSASKEIRKEVKALSGFALSSLTRNQINSLVATMHGINSETTLDEDFLFAVLPIAYASLAINELTEAIADPQKGIAISANLKRNLQYVLGEI